MEIKPIISPVVRNHTDVWGRNTRINNLNSLAVPITGANGVKIVGYDWVATTELANFMVERAVSDWKAAAVSDKTGRKIVHLFTVEYPSGEQKTMSIESAAAEIGWEPRAVKTQMECDARGVVGSGGLRFVDYDGEEERFDVYIGDKKIGECWRDLHYYQGVRAWNEDDTIGNLFLLKRKQLTGRQTREELQKRFRRAANKLTHKFVDGKLAKWRRAEAERKEIEQICENARRSA